MNNTLYDIIENFAFYKMLYSTMQIKENELQEKAIKYLNEIVNYCISPTKNVTFGKNTKNCDFCKYERAAAKIKFENECTYIHDVLECFKEYFKIQNIDEEIDYMLKLMDSSKKDF